MSKRKCTPAPETVQSGVYEKVNTMLKKERTDKLTEGVSDSAKYECDAAYERYKNEVAVNDADNELADSPNDTGVIENENAKKENKRPTGYTSLGEIDYVVARRKEAKLCAMALMEKAMSISQFLDFDVEHVSFDVGKIREYIRISGRDEHGKRYQLELSETEPEAVI